MYFNAAPGSLLASSVKVLSSTVSDNVRTVVLQRPVVGPTGDHFTFPTSPGDLGVIAAIGDSVSLAYHKAGSSTYDVRIET